MWWNVTGLKISAKTSWKYCATPHYNQFSCASNAKVNFHYTLFNNIYLCKFKISHCRHKRKWLNISLPSLYQWNTDVYEHKYVCMHVYTSAYARVCLYFLNIQESKHAKFRKSLNCTKQCCLFKRLKESQLSLFSGLQLLNSSVLLQHTNAVSCVWM